MATSIMIEWDSRDLTQRLGRAADKQLPFAIALALTRTAQKIKTEEYEEMKRVFDRPTPYTLNSLAMRPAKKSDLAAGASVFFKEFSSKGTPASRYLMPQVSGGGRRNKRFEGALRRAGVLGSNEFAVPARGAPKDSYGNVRRSIYSKILSDLAAQSDPLQNTKVGAGKYFVGKIGKARGIFQPAAKGNLKMLFVFTGQPSYRPRFAFFDIAMRVQTQAYARQFELAIDEALRTAR